METMHGEPAKPWMVLAKCAAGLALVVMLVVTVVSDERVMRDSLVHGGTPPRAAAAAMSPAEHRKQVFVERYQRFRGDAEKRKVAGEMMK